MIMCDFTFIIVGGRVSLAVRAFNCQSIVQRFKSPFEKAFFLYAPFNKQTNDRQPSKYYIDDLAYLFSIKLLFVF